MEFDGYFLLIVKFGHSFGIISILGQITLIWNLYFLKIESWYSFLAVLRGPVVAAAAVSQWGAAEAFAGL